MPMTFLSTMATLILMCYTALMGDMVFSTVFALMGAVLTALCIKVEHDRREQDYDPCFSHRHCGLCADTGCPHYPGSHK